MHRYWLLLAWLLASSVVNFVPLEAADAPPNILIAIADDWGYGHAGAYQTKWVNTPAFDEVARQGCCLNVPIRPTPSALRREPAC